jgi:hypothetical protein
VLDLAEDIPHHEATQVHAQLSSSLETNTASHDASRKMVLMGLFQNFAQRLMRMDNKGASRVIDSLKSYLQNYDSKKGEFQSIEEYTEYRIINVGFWYVFSFHTSSTFQSLTWNHRIMESFMQWTLGMALTETEQQITHELCLSAGRAMGLTNDLYSWNVERNDPADRQWNAVPVIMKQYNLNEEMAVIFLKGMIVQHEQKTRELGLEVKKCCSGSKKMATYVDAMGIMLGGNLFWSSNCPRYNDEAPEL